MDRMMRSRTSRAFVISGCASLALAACATMDLARFPAPANSSFTPVESVPGISIFAQPVLDEALSRKHFGVDLREKGILAVYVATRNTSPNTSLMFPADSVRLSKTGSGSGPDDPQRGDQQAGEAFGMIGAVLISPIFLAVGAQQLSDASVIEENFERQELRTSMVDPGEVVSGFSYFDAKQLKGTDKAQVCWRLEDPVKRESLPVCFPIRLGG